MSSQVAELRQECLVDADENTAVPVGYKQTEVGMIPEDWEIVALRQLIKAIESGVSVNSSDAIEAFSHGMHVLKTSCVSKGFFHSLEVKSILPKDITRAKCSVLKGAIIISRMNTPALVGEIGFIPIDYPNLFLPDRLWQIRLLSGIYTDSKWLSYFLSYPSNALKIKETATGTSGSMKNISKNSFLSLDIYLPPQQERTLIANALSDVDALLDSLEKLIAKKQAIKTATMQQLLTGRTRLPEFAFRDDGTRKGYKESELGEVPEDWGLAKFNTLTKLSSTRINPKADGNSDFCIEMEHISQGSGYLLGHTETKETSSLKSIFENGDVLFGKLRAYLKKYWFADRSGVCSTEIWVLKVEQKKAVSSFIFYHVQTDKFTIAASEAYGTHMPRADWKTISEFPLAIPIIEEQTAIASILSDMDTEIQTLEQRLAKTRQIKQGMMQELLTGKTRLVKPAKEIQHE